MAKYRKKPVVIGATQWHKNGDHPDDECYYVDDKSPDRFLSEGKLVRRHQHPENGKDVCKQCGRIMHVHGWIDTLEGGHIVCPGDFIITGVQGERYPCKPDIFAETYDLKEDDVVRENLEETCDGLRKDNMFLHMRRGDLVIERDGLAAKLRGAVDLLKDIKFRSGDRHKNAPDHREDIEYQCKKLLKEISDAQ